MKRSSMVLLAALGVGFVGTGHAQAQFSYQRPQTSPFNQPAVSPYLNLVRPDASAGINYTTLVRPQVDTGRAIQNLQYQVTQDQQILMGQLSAAPAGFNPGAALPLTGHPAQFMNYSHYFTKAAARQGTAQTPGPRR